MFRILSMTLLTYFTLFTATVNSLSTEAQATAVVVHKHFKAIIDCNTKLPLVVAYRTTRDVSDAKRHPHYLPDPTLMENRPDCHPNLNHRFKTYQAKLTYLGIKNEQYDVGHLAMSNHLDYDDESIKTANYFTNLAPQVAQKNRSGGAWYATEKIVECHRDIEPLINFVGVHDDPSTTDQDYFVSSFGQTTPDYWWRVIYFEKSDLYFAWWIPNVANANESRLYKGDFDIDLSDLVTKLNVVVPELETLVKRSTAKADREFVETKTNAQWLTCRGQRAHIS